MNNGKVATITIEITVYEDQVVGVAKGTKWLSKHGGKCIKTTPWSTRYGRWTDDDKGLKQAILEVTEPQIDFSMEDLGITED